MCCRTVCVLAAENKMKTKHKTRPFLRLERNSGPHANLKLDTRIRFRIEGTKPYIPRVGSTRGAKVGAARAPPPSYSVVACVQNSKQNQASRSEERRSTSSLLPLHPSARRQSQIANPCSRLDRKPYTREVVPAADQNSEASRRREGRWRRSAAGTAAGRPTR
jgi:hypothetical protein